MGVLGGVFVLKSGLRILIQAPQVPFLVPPKTPILGVFGYFGGTEKGTWGATRNCNVLFEFSYFGFLDPPNGYSLG